MVGMMKICEYYTKDHMERVLNKFENMENEVKRINLVKNFEYDLSLQFLERLENDERINAQEKLHLRNKIKNEDRELIVNNSMEVFKKFDAY